MRGEALPPVGDVGLLMWLLLSALWDVTSAIFLIWTVNARDLKSAWWWGASFVGASLVAAYFFWRLL